MSNRNINDLNKALLKNLRTNKVAFPTGKTNGKVYQYIKEDYQEVLSNEAPLGIGFNTLNDLSEWHLISPRFSRHLI